MILRCGWWFIPIYPSIVGNLFKLGSSYELDRIALFGSKYEWDVILANNAENISAKYTCIHKV